MRAADAALGRSALSEAVARYYAKLLAYKDEYEVARLHTDGAFMAEIGRRFEGRPKLQLHLAPPLLAPRDPATGHLKKRAYGPWIFTAMRYLARMKRLRGRWLDPFGHSEERRTERRLIADYEGVIEELLARLSPENYRPRRRDRADPGADPRLRPCQAAPPGGRQASRGGASGGVSGARGGAYRRCLRLYLEDAVRTRGRGCRLLPRSM